MVQLSSDLNDFLQNYDLLHLIWEYIGTYHPYDAIMSLHSHVTYVIKEKFLKMCVDK